MSGANQEITAGTDHKTILKWHAPRAYDCSCCIDALGPQNVTITVSAQLANDADEGPNVDLTDVFATVEWGSGSPDGGGCGVDCQEIDFDIVDGGSITVQACSFIVQITYPGPNDGGNHPPIDVNVSVGMQTSGKGGIASSARRTIKIGDTGAGQGTINPGNASAPQKQPRFAITARLQNSSITVPTMVLRQMPAELAPAISEGTIGKGETEGIRHANGARYFQLQNPNVDPSFNTAVIFDLGPN